MNEANEHNAQAEPVAADVEAPSDNSQSSSSDDTWGSAREAYFKDSKLEEYGESTEDGSSNDGEADSHIEADQADQTEEQGEPESSSSDDIFKVDLDKVFENSTVPHKYRPQINEKINAILADVKAQATQLGQGYQESNSALLRAFVDVIQSDNPLQALHGYAEQVAPQLGIAPEVLEKLVSSNVGQQQNVEVPTYDPSVIQTRIDDEVSRIQDHYWPLMEAEQDAGRARQLFADMNRQIRHVENIAGEAKLKAVLSAFHNKLVKPHIDEFGKIKSQTEAEQAKIERTAKVGLWNSADQEMKSNADWPKYKAKVKQLMKTEYAPLVKIANESGTGHKKLMQDLYLIVSRNDHLVTARQPQRGNPAVKPSGKYIKTQSAGGSSWDDIQQADWPETVD